MGMSKRNEETSGVWPWVEKILGFSDLITSLYAAVVAAGVLYLLGIIVLALVPSWSEAESFSVTIRNIALIIGGVVGFVFAFRRLAQTDEQIEISDTEAKTRLRDEDRKDREEVEKSFDKAVAALNGEDIAFSLYGASRMKQLAIDHSKDYLETAIRLIGNRARRIGHSASKLEDADQVETDNPKGFERAQEFATIAVELAVLYEQNEKRKSPLDLSGVNLINFQLSGITVTPEMISECMLHLANFQGCTFNGIFTNKLDMRGVTFRGCRFDKLFQNGSGCVFDQVEFVGCVFDECTFGGDNFSGCVFKHIKLHASQILYHASHSIFFGSGFSHVSFTFGDPEGTEIDANFRKHFLPVDFGGCYFLEHPKGVSGLENNSPPLEVELLKESEHPLRLPKIAFKMIESKNLHSD